MCAADSTARGWEVTGSKRSVNPPARSKSRCTFAGHAFMIFVPTSRVGSRMADGMPRLRAALPSGVRHSRYASSGSTVLPVACAMSACLTTATGSIRSQARFTTS
jgi:hypothetical protein